MTNTNTGGTMSAQKLSIQDPTPVTETPVKYQPTERGYRWPQVTPTQYVQEVCSSRGISDLKELLDTTNVLHLRCAGISYDLLVSSPTSSGIELTARLAEIFASIANLQLQLGGLLTAVTPVSEGADRRNISRSTVQHLS